MKTKQKTITQNDLLKLRGLTVLRDENRKEHDNLVRAIAEIVKERPESYGDNSYYGHVSDYMWEDFGPEGLLDKLNIKIIKNERRRKTKANKR